MTRFATWLIAHHESSAPLGPCEGYKQLRRAPNGFRQHKRSHSAQESYLSPGWTNCEIFAPIRASIKSQYKTSSAPMGPSGKSSRIRSLLCATSGFTRLAVRPVVVHFLMAVMMYRNKSRSGDNNAGCDSRYALAQDRYRLAWEGCRPISRTARVFRGEELGTEECARGRNRWVSPAERLFRGRGAEARKRIGHAHHALHSRVAGGLQRGVVVGRCRAPHRRLLASGQRGAAVFVLPDAAVGFGGVYRRGGADEHAIRAGTAPRQRFLIFPRLAHRNPVRS